MTNSLAPRGLQTSATKDGATLGHGSYDVSEDGSTMTATVRGIDGAGKAFEQIIAPPQGAAGAAASQAPLQTTNLINFQNSVVNNENNLVTTWYNYQLQRLQVYRDLGILPFDEWEAYDEIFPSDQSGGGYAAAVGPDGRPAVARSAVPSPAVERN